MRTLHNIPYLGFLINNSIFLVAEQKLLYYLVKASKFSRTKTAGLKGNDITKMFKFITEWLTNVSALKSLLTYLNQVGPQGLKTPW